MLNTIGVAVPTTGVADKNAAFFDFKAGYARENASGNDCDWHGGASLILARSFDGNAIGVDAVAARVAAQQAAVNGCADARATGSNIHNMDCGPRGLDQ